MAHPRWADVESDTLSEKSASSLHECAEDFGKCPSSSSLPHESYDSQRAATDAAVGSGTGADSGVDGTPIFLDASSFFASITQMFTFPSFPSFNNRNDGSTFLTAWAIPFHACFVPAHSDSTTFARDAPLEIKHIREDTPAFHNLPDALNPLALYTRKGKSIQRRGDRPCSVAVARFKSHFSRQPTLNDIEVSSNIIILTETVWSSQDQPCFYICLGVCLGISSTTAADHLAEHVGHPCVSASGIRLASQLLARVVFEGIFVFHDRALLVEHFRSDGSVAELSYASGYKLLQRLPSSIAILYQPYHYFPLRGLLSKGRGNPGGVEAVVPISVTHPGANYRGLSLRGW